MQSKCGNCNRAIPSMAYPKVFCMLRSEYVNQNETCARFEQKEKK